MRKIWSKINFFDDWYFTFLFIVIIIISIWAIDTRIIVPKEINGITSRVTDKYIEDFWNRDEYILIVKMNNTFYKEIVTANIYYSVEVDDFIYFVNTESRLFHSPSHFLELP